MQDNNNKRITGNNIKKSLNTIKLNRPAECNRSNLAGSGSLSNPNHGLGQLKSGAVSLLAPQQLNQTALHQQQQQSGAVSLLAPQQLNTNIQTALHQQQQNTTSYSAGISAAINNNNKPLTACEFCGNFYKNVGSHKKGCTKLHGEVSSSSRSSSLNSNSSSSLAPIKSNNYDNKFKQYNQNDTSTSIPPI